MMANCDFEHVTPCFSLFNISLNHVSVFFLLFFVFFWLKMFAFIKENIKKGNSKEARSQQRSSRTAVIRTDQKTIVTPVLYNHSITNRLPFLFTLAIANRFHGIPVHLKVTVPPLYLIFILDETEFSDRIVSIDSPLSFPVIFFYGGI